MKKIIPVLLLAIFILSYRSVANASDDETKIQELEQRISALEETVSALENLLMNGESAGTENSSEISQTGETITLGAGVYVVGEDIAEGKYDFAAIRGSGTLRTYKNYDQFHEEEYDYEMQYELAAEDSSSMKMFSEMIGDMYGTSASNVRLKNGECFSIESGLEIQVTQK